jgi:hypothetical protein
MNNNENIDKLKKISRDYLCARKKFREIADTIPELTGNDNIVGRIGEFIALQFLRDICGNNNVIRNECMVEAGYDILADGRKVSVKIITSENTTGATTRVRDPWDELVLIELDGCNVARIGFLKKEKLAEEHGKLNPIARRTMLNERGLIGRYGKVYSGNAVKKYL